MIHLLYGTDAYQITHAMRSIRAELRAQDEMLDSNTTVLDGREVTPQELMAHATSVPFLAANRLVIVEGLLQALGGIKRGRAKKKAAADDPLEPWRLAAAQLADPATTPDTTTLIFLEGDLTPKNPAFTIFAPIAKSVDYKALAAGELVAWVKNAAKRTKLQLSEDGARCLVKLVGADLWSLQNELEKLAAYAGGAAVGEAAVTDLVSAAHDAKIWDVADAVVAGDERKALTSLRRLLGDGMPPPVLMSMIVRQYRQLLLVKDLRERRAGRGESARIAGLPEWKLDNVGAMAQRYSGPRLREAYALLLDADLSIKRGLQDDESALQLLIHELCAMRPAPAARPAYGR